MMNSAFAAACLVAGTALADPTLIEAKAGHFSEDVANDIVITQVSGQQNFVLLPQYTSADPDPVCTACTEVFNVGGVWNVANVDLASVTFQCKLAGAVAYNHVYPCTSTVGGNDYGNCPAPSGAIGEVW